mmetsp:Transcript_9795/g.20076  ORF Transcript_9795/g.20076 Transcript_9795/m.20076 type:complete len:109 (-) Transcript_9795:18-344(-)
MQKSAWRSAGNTGFMCSGLFKYSQHPNYFGEMLLWSSLCLSSMNGLRTQWERLAAAASPTFVVCLIRFVSGVPLLRKANKKKYGSDPAYLNYVARTSLLLPWFPKQAP